ncbi:MAG TPA: cell shape determination protein CcmA [Cryomorphaceae bacterium]|jgi:cytoskeletal protein CcmA (bactofilin family)|nr:cell shape determination protein CcmA [Cryomorphaceae bacterium]HBK20913.1 cell shape determination protein CcmA [Cryomorphaceae bacterium]|tara:strand:+ start:214 stop:612 length:399 start_codon:yes stop_codon:yes gene_type:complete
MISSAKKYPEQAQASNRILAGTSITGDIVSDGDIRVDGKVAGSMKVTGKLVIGEHGLVEGEVECKNAAIAGQLEGTINVAQSLSLSASAKVKGKVQVEKLAVEPGAEINGSLAMGAVMRKVNESDKDSVQSA